MSITVLQNKIRKLKNPAVVDFGVLPDELPTHLIAEEGSIAKAYGRFCRELMSGLKGVVPAVRFNWGAFALLGPEGSLELISTLSEAVEKNFYVILDAPEILSKQAATAAADAIWGDENSPWKCDGLVVSSYIGSDAVKPFYSYCKDREKDLFVVVRTSNKTAAEIQDLLTGTRLVHMAAADLANRSGIDLGGKYGYTQVAAVAAASSPDSLRTLRGKYPGMFMLIDGFDYPNGNAKNCSFAFDKFGHGAIACAGTSITCAWKQTESDGHDFVFCAIQAAERMKKNLIRYITVM